MKKTLFLLLFIFILSLLLQGQEKDISYLKEANKKYNSKKYDDAESQYTTISKNKNTYEVNFNKGNAQFQQKKTQEAINTYNTALQKSKNVVQKSKTNYNIGNSYMDLKNYKEALEHYKKAILQNPNDKQAKENYIIAKKKQKQQEEQKNKDSTNDKNQPQEENQNNTKDKNDPKDKDDNKENKGEENKANKPIQNKNNNQNPKPNDVNEGEYEGILEAMNQQEQNTQKKIINQKTQSKKRFKEKNW